MINSYNSYGGFNSYKAPNSYNAPNSYKAPNSYGYTPTINQSYLNQCPTFLPETKGPKETKGAKYPNIFSGSYGSNMSWNQAPSYTKLPNMSWGQPNDYGHVQYPVKKIANNGW